MTEQSAFHRRLLVSIALLAILIATPVLAQDRGPTPIGREGATWQHGIDRAEELQAQILADLGRLSEDDWKAKSLAWVRFETDGATKPSQLEILDSHRVGDLDAKKTEIERRGEKAAPTWVLRFAKKPPKSVDLVLTDVNETAINCKTGPAIDARAGHLGIFVHEGSLFCLTRPNDGADVG